MASGLPRKGLVIPSSASAAASSGKATSKAAAPRMKRAPTRRQGARAARFMSVTSRRLLPRQHLLDDLGIVQVTFIDFALYSEHPEHSALRRRIVEVRVAAQSGENGDILLAVQFVGDRRGVDSGAGLELP